jgi:hypothetical protein
MGREIQGAAEKRAIMKTIVINSNIVYSVGITKGRNSLRDTGTDRRLTLLNGP